MYMWVNVGSGNVVKVTMPHALDTALGTPGRDYFLLPEDNFVLQGFDEATRLWGFESIMRIQQFYQNL